MFYCDGFSLNHVVMKLQLRYNESCDIKLNPFMIDLFVTADKLSLSEG